MEHPETIEIKVNGESVIINADDLPLWADKVDAEEPKPKRAPKVKVDAEEPKPKRAPKVKVDAEEPKPKAE